MLLLYQYLHNSGIVILHPFGYQAADGGPLQRRRSASGRDGTWLSDWLRSEYVAAGAPHDLQWRLRGGRVRAMRPVGILRVVRWPLLFSSKPRYRMSFRDVKTAWNNARFCTAHDPVYITVYWKRKKIDVALSFSGKSLTWIIIQINFFLNDSSLLWWHFGPCSTQSEAGQ